jgi:hypothetical protein
LRQIDARLHSKAPPPTANKQLTPPDFVQERPLTLLPTPPVSPLLIFHVALGRSQPRVWPCNLASGADMSEASLSLRPSMVSPLCPNKADIEGGRSTDAGGGHHRAGPPWHLMFLRFRGCTVAVPGGGWCGVPAPRGLTAAFAAPPKTASSRGIVDHPHGRGHTAGEGCPNSYTSAPVSSSATCPVPGCRVLSKERQTRPRAKS